MHIVVTGTAGFIGSHTAIELSRRGHKVTGIDSFDDFLYSAEIKKKNHQQVQESIGDSYQFHTADITDATAMESIISSDVDVVIHLAALAGVRPSLTDPSRYISTNLRGTTNILEAMRKNGVKRLACASSSSVYGSKGTSGALGDVQAFREDDPCLTPASPYAATKRSAELICSSYRDLFGIGISNLRFFTVYGPRQRPDMAINKFFRWIEAGQPLTMFGDGSSRRDYTYIDDIVAGTVASAERVRPGSFNTYNLGGTQTTGLKELIEKIEKVMGKQAIIKKMPMQPGDVPITFADITNAKRDLDYMPTTPIDDGLEKYWQWVNGSVSA